MKRTLIALSIIGIGTVVASPSRGQSGASLSSEQQQAKTRFDKDIAEVMEEVEETCGGAIPVKTDFENFNSDAWGKERPGRTCGAALEAVERLCPRPAERRDRDAPKRAGDGGRTTVQVKSVVCTFAGAAAAGAGEDSEDVARKNVTFEGGVLTVRMRPGTMYNVEDTTRRILLGEQRSSGLKLGSKCSANAACRSGLCQRNTCQTCSSDAACGKGRICGDGSCFKPVVRKTNLPNGAACGANDECRSSICRMRLDARGWPKGRFCGPR